MRRFCIVAGLLVLTGLCAFATEGGGGAYPNGAEGFMSGALPPPGHYYVNYLMYYQADELKDANGDKIPMDFDLTVVANVLRFVNVTKTQVLGASWAQHVFVPVMMLDVSAAGMSDDATGIGDIIVDPIILGWHNPPWHCVAGVDVYLPVGKYDRADMANLGRNHLTVEPVVAVTYLGQSGLEASAKFMYDVNFENSDTDYESGDEFHCDYALGRHSGNWTFGAGGFCYRQVSDDKGEPNMGKGVQASAGPQISYQGGKLNFRLKYEKEFGTENKPEGDRAWLVLVCPF